MMIADTLGSYGTMARFTSLQRIRVVHGNILIGASGEYSDFQYINKLLDELSIVDFEHADGRQLTGSEIYAYMSRVLYNRRCKADPLYNQLLIASMDVPVAGTPAVLAPPLVSAPSTADSKDAKGKDAKSSVSAAAASSSIVEPAAKGDNKEVKGARHTAFLGLVDLYGSAYTDDFQATGFGAYLAMPLMRKHWRADMSYAEARQLLEKGMEVCFYRDCRAFNKFILATVGAGGAKVEAPFSLRTQWEYSLFVQTDAVHNTVVSPWTGPGAAAPAHAVPIGAVAGPASLVPMRA